LICKNIVAGSDDAPGKDQRLRFPMITRIRIALFIGLLTLTVFSSEPRQTALAKSPEKIRFQLDPAQSKFIAHALRGGLLWFKGHEHLVAAREFSGEAQITMGSMTPAALWLAVHANSMVETSDAFTEAQKQIINKELRDIVLEPEKYPEIIFKSNEVTGKANRSGGYDAKIGGDLTLHGVTRHIVIPAQVTLNGSELRAAGTFTIDRSDFNVKATSAFHGMVRVRKTVKFTFDIVGHRI
jgi:hypothetical protein